MRTPKVDRSLKKGPGGIGPAEQEEMRPGTLDSSAKTRQ